MPGRVLTSLSGRMAEARFGNGSIETRSERCLHIIGFGLRFWANFMAKAKNQNMSNGSGLDFEAQLWAAADKMRGHMDASEYKHVCLGLIFLKYISDAFEEKREQLLFGFSDPKSEWFIKDEPERAEAAENRDEYLAANVFWLPPEARWHKINAKAKSPEIGKIIDDAMGAIERENPTLKGVLPRDYARPSLDKVRLGGLVDIISNIGFSESAAKSKDVLGRVYEYFLGKFASAEGKGGGEFYTPQCVVQVLVAMLEPYKGRVFDPCCGSGGVRVLGKIRGGTRWARGRHRRLWPGIQLYHLETGADESRHSRHRCQSRSAQRRQLPARIASRPQGRFHSGQSPVQHERLGRRKPTAGRALEIRDAAGEQRQLCLDSTFHPSPLARGSGRICSGERFNVHADLERRRDSQGVD